MLVPAPLGDDQARRPRQERIRDETCPISTGGGTRRVQLVREGGGGAPRRAVPCTRHPAAAQPRDRRGKPPLPSRERS